MKNKKDKGEKLMSNSKKIKIDVVVPPFSGHLNPVLGLLESLIGDDTYDIRIYTGAKKKNL